MIKAAIKNNFYKIDFYKEEIIVDGQEFDLDMVKLSEGKYHIISDHKSYSVELVSLDKTKKLVSVKVNNHVYEVALKDKMDELLEKLGMDNLTEAKTEDLKAPMPGLILEIAVEKGQSVAKGDKLLILEAMKMENVIKAAGDAVIEGIKVKVGDSVDNGQILITFE
ncbi:Methylcrotonyl-CoA carboxylase biotin-containing subunit [hydrothermal vent metagenome]|uniref:Methylcrotonyl-CoA carboxylase biotin-containing subunit n=1 Tax=hydrothermal vent metagenome TaxID=652676 RepID=A0A3B0UFA6_9ZZZZ